MAKGKTLADMIGSSLATVMRRRTWWDQLSPEAQSELLEVRRQFQFGEYGPKAKSLTVAKMLVTYCEERGWKVGDARRMSEWLRENH